MQLLAVENISKRFGSFYANKDISFTLNSGEIVSLLGENGAGKTTLMNILYGLYTATEGNIFVRGKEVSITRPKDAISLGISMVHQHFMLVDALTVTENIIIGNEPTKNGFLDFSYARRRVEELSRLYGLDVKGDAVVGKLSVGEKQRVELIKALFNDCDILILDEPTAVLTPHEVDNFFAILRKLRAAGKGIILISHKLHETMEIADRIYIMRSGEIIVETTPESETVEKLAEMMVGRPLAVMTNRILRTEAHEMFSLENVSCTEKKNEVLHPVSLKLREGEILGIAGVDGNGQSELIELVTGIRRASSGVIQYRGQDITDTGMADRIAAGIGYIPEDRHKALVGTFSLAENSILGYQNDPRFTTRKTISWKKVGKFANDILAKYDVRCRGAKEEARSLSGGNQQKLIIGRVFESLPHLIVAAQPTRGVDIGAVEYIHQCLVDMRNKGKAVLLVSADLDEIIKLSDEIAVMYDRRIVCDALNGTYTKAQLGSFMTGGRN